MQRHALTLDEMLAFPPLHTLAVGAQDPRLSADGRRIVYAHQGCMWLREVDEPEPQRLGEGAGPRWSSNADEIVFQRGQPTEVWIRDLRGGERRIPLPSDDVARGEMPLIAFSLSPDGLQIASVHPAPETRLEQPNNLPDTIVEVHRKRLPPGHVLRMTNVASGDSREIARSAPGTQWITVAWSPDGQQLALDEMIAVATDHELQRVITVVDLQSGAAHYPAGRTRHLMYYPSWSPDGARLAFPYSPQDYIAPFRTVCGIVAASGSEVALFATDYFIHSGVRWHPDGRTLFCIGNRGITTQVLRVDTTTEAVQPLTQGPGLHYAPSLSADGKWLACLYASPTTLPEIYLLSTDGRERRRLTHVNNQLARFRLSEVEIVYWKAPDGLELSGLLVKPLDYQPGQRYPTIVDVHGGPYGGEWLCFHPEWHWLAAHGYLVFMPEFRGSQLYGWYGPRTETQDVEDTLAGMDWLVEAGYADPDRLGVRGHSYGADLTLWIICQTQRFRAAVMDGVSCHAEVSYGTAFGGGGSPITERLLGGKPWEVPEVYRLSSPLTYIPNARTPTLILQGAEDGIVEPQMLYTWLRQSGVEVELVKYMGEGHVISKREHRADFWRRTIAWFDRHLKG